MFYNIPGEQLLVLDMESLSIDDGHGEMVLIKTFDTTIPQLSTPGVLKLKDRAVTRFSSDCVDTN